MITHPSMTSRGRLWAAILGIVFAFALPKDVDCGMPGATCTLYNAEEHRTCTPYETVPFGIYLIESGLHRKLGVAYSSHDGCR